MQNQNCIHGECHSLAALKKYHLEMAGYRIAQKKLAAAKRAVSIVNRKSLRKWPRLAEHRSRVFRNLNKLRAV